MADAYGNIIEVPGTGQVAEVKPSDIIAAYNPAPLIKGRTIKGGAGLIAAGTAMARQTSTKKGVPYASAGSDGANLCEGFLLESVQTGTGGTSADAMGNIVLGGVLKLSALSGLAAGALTTLNARSDYARDLFIF